jgi:hypothetical protein
MKKREREDREKVKYAKHIYALSIDNQNELGIVEMNSKSMISLTNCTEKKLDLKMQEMSVEKDS